MNVERLRTNLPRTVAAANQLSLTRPRIYKMRTLTPSRTRRFLAYPQESVSYQLYLNPAAWPMAANVILRDKWYFTLDWISHQKNSWKPYDSDIILPPY